MFNQNNIISCFSCHEWIGSSEVVLNCAIVNEPISQLEGLIMGENAVRTYQYAISNRK